MGFDLSDLSRLTAQSLIGHMRILPEPHAQPKPIESSLAPLLVTVLVSFAT